ncbi:MAG: hypothetical protein WD267_02295 [Balneolales bacterium]
MLHLILFIAFQTLTGISGSPASINTTNKIQLLSSDGSATALSYFNTTPESPDGQRIVYMKFDTNTETSKQKNPGSLWVFDKNTQRHHEICRVNWLPTPHNAAMAQWVDDRHIAFMEGHHVKVVEIDDGNIIMGPVKGHIGHTSHQKKILLNLDEDDGPWEQGVYQIDVFTGERRLIIRPKDFVNYAERMGMETDPVEEWKTLHAQWSPNGKKIALRLDVKKDGTEKERILVSLNTDGSVIRIFGPKPMHFLWFDNHTFLGHDHQVDDGQPNNRSLRRWDQDGKFVETLAGPGNHLGAAPGRWWFASESW